MVKVSQMPVSTNKLYMTKISDAGDIIAARDAIMEAAESLSLLGPCSYVFVYIYFCHFNLCTSTVHLQWLIQIVTCIFFFNSLILFMTVPKWLVQIPT